MFNIVRNTLKKKVSLKLERLLLSPGMVGFVGKKRLKLLLKKEKLFFMAFIVSRLLGPPHGGFCHDFEITLTLVKCGNFGGNFDRH